MYSGMEDEIGTVLALIYSDFLWEQELSRSNSPSISENRMEPR